MERQYQRILIVENHRDTGQTLVSVLRTAGHHVECCTEVTKALTWLHRGHFDVLLTDWLLPGMGGAEFVSEAFKRGINPARVISMSAGVEASLRRQSAEVGCHGHLTKPFTPQQLQGLLA